MDTVFQDWAQMVWWHPNTDALGSQVSLGDFRKEMQIEVCNQAVALASLTLEHEGWERDPSVTAPPPVAE